jgi:hypothetical protein
MVSEQDSAGSRTASGGREALRLLLGLVDVGLEQAEHAAHVARGLLGRSDLGELASDVRTDLGARGDAVIGRVAPSAESHMETLARRAQAAQAAQAARDAGDAQDAGVQQSADIADA